MTVQVVVLNGGSSSGKTTLGRALQRVLPGPRAAFGVDTLADAVPGIAVGSAAARRPPHWGMLRGVTGGDPWAREVALARTTAVWGAASVVGGLGFAARFRRDPWRRAFGVQNAGWGAVDLAVVVVAERLRRRRMARLADPYEPAELRAEGRRLWRVLLLNVGLDAGYVVGGLALWRWRRGTGAAAGASAGIVAQGAFLLAHDAHHAHRS